ncbi:unnamed protein product [Polarella glacialis]|uniref:Hexosyltransferase n=1 Tax=Polarella glacialis TaxID=89957 RepID=A0A813G4U0_POLGL|nr:unnamed protein product [Polarella glacialis]
MWQRLSPRVAAAACVAAVATVVLIVASAGPVAAVASHATGWLQAWDFDWAQGGTMFVPPASKRQPSTHQLPPLPAPVGFAVGSPSEVFVALLMGQSYLPGLKALAASLLDHNASQPLVVMTTDLPSPELLRLSKCLRFQVQWVPAIANPYVARIPQWTWVMSKLSVFRLKVRRAVYLDLDTILLRNIDELFAGSVFDAVADPGYHVANFNSGLMVTSPSEEVYQDMIAKLYADAASLSGEGIDSGDQGFLNWYFGDTWRPETALPGRYNTLLCEEITCNETLAGREIDQTDYTQMNKMLPSSSAYGKLLSEMEASVKDGTADTLVEVFPQRELFGCGCHLWRPNKDLLQCG